MYFKKYIDSDDIDSNDIEFPIQLFKDHKEYIQKMKDNYSKDLKINFEYRVKGSSKLNYKILIYLLQFIIFRIFQKTYRLFKILT